MKRPRELSVSPKASPLTARAITWVLMLPFIFFAVHGNFSFLMGTNGNRLASGSFSGMVSTRNFGILGYGVLPGIAYGIVMYLLLTNLRAVIDMALRRKALTFLAVLTILSAAWSQDPVRSLYNGGFYLIGTLFAYYLVLKFSQEEIMQLVKMCGVVACLLSAIMVAFFPQYGIFTEGVRTYGSWMGIFQDRVSAAKVLVFLLSPALVFGRSKNLWRNLLYVALLLIFIVMAQAVSALLVTFTFASFMLVLYLSRRLERRTALLLGCGFAALCAAFVLLGIPYLAQLLGLFGRDLTLTGRTEIWGILMTSIAKHPFLGYGYYAFWQGMKGESANVILAAHWFFGYAHNGLLEVVLQLGLVGTAVFLVTFVNACKDGWFCLRHGRSAGVEWYVGLLVLVVLYNIDEETVVWPNDLLSIMYIIACCGLAVHARRIREQREPSAEDATSPSTAPWREVAAA